MNIASNSTFQELDAMFIDVMVRQARATGKPYALADFDRLSLFVSSGGTRNWYFRYTWLGKRARISRDLP